MSNSQNKKNEQQNNLCTTLTEQWKKGELENDWYYIRTTNGIEKWEYIKQSHGFGYYETEWVLEVLAPVPSYDHFVEITEKVKKNQQLKELLDYCRELLEMDGYENVVEEINNAIGEK